MKLNKTALITGAGSGIGQAQALAFLQEGYRVIGLDCQNNFQILEDSAQEGSLSTFVADVSDETTLEEIFKEIRSQFNQIDVLCNTAGSLDAYRNLEDTDYQLWRTIIMNNLGSMFLVTKMALPLLLNSESPRVINMASIAGLTGGGGGIAYTTSKHGVIGFTKQLAYDYSAYGLRANAIAPGAIKTPMNKDDFVGEGQIAEEIRQQIPVQRWAEPEEVAGLSLFLASDGADYLQGAVIPIDGGWMIR